VKTKQKSNSKAAENTSEQVKDEKTSGRFTLNVTPEGKIDFSRMQTSTREKLRAMFADPAVAEALGMSGAAAPGIVDVIPPGMVAGMWDMFGKLQQLVMPLFFPKVKPDIWTQVFIYSPEEKAQLIPPTTRVLNKYATEWMIKYQDELLLAGLFLTITFAKINMAITLQKMADGSYGVPGTETTPPQPPSVQ